jgi:uncharacterized protein
MSKIVACPVCGVAVPWRSDSAWRPFCSERCKSIDLGEWAAERHAIAGQIGPGDEATVPAATDPLEH